MTLSNIFYWTFLFIAANFAIVSIHETRKFKNFLYDNKTLVWCSMCILMVTTDFTWHVINLYIFEALFIPSIFILGITFFGFCASAIVLIPIYGLLYAMKW